jgi:hypothetical protein
MSARRVTTGRAFALFETIGSNHPTCSSVDRLHARSLEMNTQRQLTSFLCLALLATAGCASPPQAEIDASTQAIEAASQAQAQEYAPESFQKAQEAKAALDAELTAQNQSFAPLRQYSKATELAATATAAAQQAAQDAAAARQAARDEATRLVNEATMALQDARTVLAGAPAGKGGTADLATMQADLSTAETALQEASGSLASERFGEAKAKAEAVKTVAMDVKTSVEQAVQMRATTGRRR